MGKSFMDRVRANVLPRELLVSGGEVPSFPGRNQTLDEHKRLQGTHPFLAYASALEMKVSNGLPERSSNMTCPKCTG